MKYYAVVVTTLDKSGMVCVDWFGYSTSEGLRCMFIKTCTLRFDNANGNIYTVDFPSINEMYTYMKNNYDYLISGDDKIDTIPVKGTLSPYYNQHVVTTMNDIFNSETIGFMQYAETVGIKRDLRSLSSSRFKLDVKYFANDFKEYIEVITLVVEYMARTMSNTIDEQGHLAIDTERWDMPQYGILKGWYRI